MSTTIEKLKSDALALATESHDALAGAKAAYEATQAAYTQSAAMCRAAGIPDEEIPGYTPKAPRAAKGEREGIILTALASGPKTSKEIVELFGSDKKAQSSGRATMYQLEKKHKKIAKNADGAYVLAADAPAPKKRGRKPKAAGAAAVEGTTKLKKDGTPAKKRGRKPKSEVAAAATGDSAASPATEAVSADAPAKRKPGRPKKTAVSDASPVEAAPAATPAAPAVSEEVAF